MEFFCILFSKKRRIETKVYKSFFKFCESVGEPGSRCVFQRVALGYARNVLRAGLNVPSPPPPLTAPPCVSGPSHRSFGPITSYMIHICRYTPATRERNATFLTHLLHVSRSATLLSFSHPLSLFNSRLLNLLPTFHFLNCLPISAASCVTRATLRLEYPSLIHGDVHLQQRRATHTSRHFWQLACWLKNHHDFSHGPYSAGFFARLSGREQWAIYVTLYEMYAFKPHKMSSPDKY